MRVEAESTSSHGAAIVAFEASGLARVLLPKGCNGCLFALSFPFPFQYGNYVLIPFPFLVE